MEFKVMKLIDGWIGLTKKHGQTINGHYLLSLTNYSFNFL